MSNQSLVKKESNLLGFLDGANMPSSIILNNQSNLPQQVETQRVTNSDKSNVDSRYYQKDLQ